MIRREGALTPAQQIMSSCAGALLTSLLVTPLDVVKIRLQSQQKEFIKNKCFLYCNGLMDHICYCNGNGNGNGSSSLIKGPKYSKWYRRPGHFNGTLDAFVKISKTEGISSLWSGLPPTLLMAVPATVIYFTMYDQLRDNISRVLNFHSPPIWVPIVSGGLARIVAATTISPLEMVRTTMQSKKLNYFQVNEAVRSLVRKEGYLALWKGLAATILRDVPFSAIYWAQYETYKRMFNQAEPSFAFSFVAGAASGTVAAVVTTPFDVVKTHRQIELGEDKVKNGSLPSRQAEKSSRTISILRNIYSQGGFKGLFAGIAPRIIKVAPACAIMISTYESGKSFFRQHNQNKV